MFPAAELGLCLSTGCWRPPLAGRGPHVGSFGHGNGHLTWCDSQAWFCVLFRSVLVPYTRLSSITSPSRCQTASLIPVCCGLLHVIFNLGSSHCIVFLWSFVKRLCTTSKIYSPKMCGLGSALNNVIHVHAKNSWQCLLSLPNSVSFAFRSSLSR